MFHYTRVYYIIDQTITSLIKIADGKKRLFHISSTCSAGFSVSAYIKFINVAAAVYLKDAVEW